MADDTRKPQMKGVGEKFDQPDDDDNRQDKRDQDGDPVDEIFSPHAHACTIQNSVRPVDTNPAKFITKGNCEDSTRRTRRGEDHEGNYILSKKAFIFSKRKN